MGIKYLWDTNTVIYFLQQQFPPNVEKWIDNLLGQSQPVISAITEIELLCWKTAAQQDIDLLNNFISDAEIIELEKLIKLKTVDIRKTHKLKLPDAIIAASAMVYDLTFLTRNVNDFKKIENIKIINPWEIL